MYYRNSALKTSLTDSLEECGAGGLDHHVGVEQHRLEEGLGEGGQLGDQRGQPQVRPQTVVRQAAHPVMCMVRQFTSFNVWSVVQITSEDLLSTKVIILVHNVDEEWSQGRGRGVTRC